MTNLSLNGKEYRIFRFESIYEDDSIIECREIGSDFMVCEVRIDLAGNELLQLFREKVEVQLVAAVVEYVRENRR